MPNDEERQRLRDDKEAAEKIAPLVKDHHRLLVTLLLLNSIANEALPIFLDAIFPSYWAIIVSVFGVLVFGEIIPSAVFTGSHQLKIAAAFSGIVTCAESMLFPIAVPIARVLDKCLGSLIGAIAFIEQNQITANGDTASEHLARAKIHKKISAQSPTILLFSPCTEMSQHKEKTLAALSFHRRKIHPEKSQPK